MSYFAVQLAQRWTHPQLAQALADIHYSVVAREDSLSEHTHPVYVATGLALNAALATAYPSECATWGHDRFIDAVREALHDGMHDSSTVASCVNYVVATFEDIRAALAEERAAAEQDVADRRGAERAADARLTAEHDASREANPRGSLVGDTNGMSTATPPGLAPLPSPWQYARRVNEPTPFAPPIDKAAILTHHPIPSLLDSGVAPAQRTIPDMADVVERDNAKRAEDAKANRETYRITLDLSKRTTDRASREQYLNYLGDLDRELDRLGYTTCREGLGNGSMCGALTDHISNRCPSHRGQS